MVDKRELIWIRDCPTDGSNFTDYGKLGTSFPASMAAAAVNFNNASSGGNLYLYLDMYNVGDYVIQSGDYVEYDIRFSSTSVGFDYTCSDNTTLRDSGAVDQEGYSAHPAAVINKTGWYHRRIAIPESHVGKTITYFDLACENDTIGNFYMHINNIYITDGAGTNRKTILAYYTPVVSIHLQSVTTNTYCQYYTSNGRSNYDAELQKPTGYNSWIFNGWDYLMNLDYTPSLGLGTWSIMGWFYLFKINGIQGLFTTTFRPYQGSCTFVSDIRPTGIYSWVGDGTNWLYSDAILKYEFTPTPYTWYHIAFVVTPVSFKIYLNSNLVYTRSLTGAPLFMKEGEKFYLGKYDIANTTMHGVMADFRLFDFEVTRGDILAIYGGGNGNPRSLNNLRKHSLLIANL